MEEDHAVGWVLRGNKDETVLSLLDSVNPGAVVEMRLYPKGMHDLAQALLAAATAGTSTEWSGPGDIL